jgi:hypothetical protein
MCHAQPGLAIGESTRLPPDKALRALVGASWGAARAEMIW